MHYRRANTRSNVFLHPCDSFTLVTHQRQPIFQHPDAVELLRQAFRSVKPIHPFTIEAIVILPDHLHCLWTLPPEDADFSNRWRLSSVLSYPRTKRT